MQKLLVALLEAIAVVGPGSSSSGHRRTAIAGMRRKARWPIGRYIATRSFEAVMDPLIVDLHTWWRWSIDRLRMSTPGEQCSR
jgi:hypothetical protein